MSKQRTYTGHSGQMAVLAELLFRQCNVAMAWFKGREDPVTLLGVVK